MKTRLGFVSNSSSSSFVCDVCGEEVPGMDLSLSEAGMFKCVNEHTICNSHKLNGSADKEYTDVEMIDILKKYYREVDEDQPEDLKDNVEGYWEDYLEYLSDNSDTGTYDVEEKYCPCCNFIKIAKNDAIAFYITTTGKTFDDVRKEIKANCNSYAEFTNKYVSK